MTLKQPHHPKEQSPNLVENYYEDHRLFEPTTLELQSDLILSKMNDAYDSQATISEWNDIINNEDFDEVKELLYFQKRLIDFLEAHSLPHSVLKMLRARIHSKGFPDTKWWIILLISGLGLAGGLIASENPYQITGSLLGGVLCLPIYALVAPHLEERNFRSRWFHTIIYANFIAFLGAVLASMVGINAPWDDLFTFVAVTCIFQFFINAIYTACSFMKEKVDKSKNREDIL